MVEELRENGWADSVDFDTTVRLVANYRCVHLKGFGAAVCLVVNSCTNAQKGFAPQLVTHCGSHGLV